jgi:Pectinacetylesterase
LWPQEVIGSGISVEGIPDAVVQPRGIHSADPARNYAFHNWNHVYAYYCTSDSFLGALSL